MKICMLAPEFPPVWGGVGTYAFELVRHLPRNIEIHVLTTIRKRYGSEKINICDHENFTETLGDNVYVHSISEATDTFIYNGEFQYACLKYLPKLIREEHIDLIHSHTAHMPDLLVRLKKLDEPIITTIHTTIKGQREGTRASGSSFWDLEFSEKMTFIMYPFLRLIENLYFTKGHYYITPSNYMK